MSVDDRERLARVALSQILEPGDVRLLEAVRRVGAEAVHEAVCEAHRNPGRVDRALSGVAARVGGVEPARRLELAMRQGARFVVPGDDEWPTALDDLADVPPLHRRGGVPVGLWVRGPLRLDRAGRSVAIVGSRAATTYGGRAAHDIAADVAAAGLCVVSGAAFGVDQAAHRGALAGGGPTIAVLASGVDKAYPAAHAALLDLIGDHGAIVSEAPPGHAPTRIRFLARNRLIAALCPGTVVIEAALRSGALNTASWAESVGRVVMGLPGPVSSGLSQGVHELIRSRAALLVTSGAEVLEAVGASGEHLLAVPRGPARPRDRLTGRQQQVLDAVPVHRGATLASIARAAGVTPADAQRDIAELDADGFVEQSGSGWRLAPQPGSDPG
ncbi:DNA processing protein [Nocardioides zeae]|uniref:DNA processing protein n=2 Tax=Nocardioides zeae TaxID=1457234 RepID=A0ACC6IHJ9_9ACTN|nr:DNA-processing protein DprA [Nocardioides zeae]MDQ1103130.1 DNA processing protein [Nocardioides zeae]MDR6173151.1 DNA processing protein [Nocardioides zeae]MDR6210144.1 DNA processing protein [Nocardioides zeae]